MSTDQSPADALQPGHLVDGRYELRSVLAEGGMGRVWVAYDTRLDREVALKVLRSDLAARDRFAERFSVEARSAARLGHHNVVAVHDQGRDGDVSFLAMELIDGPTLRQLIDRGGLTLQRSLDVIEQTLSGLAAAHGQGLAHGDVKPENVLISSHGVAKLADFGLAQALSDDVDGPHGPHGPLFAGTAAYVAPEQVSGSGSTRATPTADVYAAGLLLFELLTGRQAFPKRRFDDQRSWKDAQVEHLPKTLPKELDDLIQLACAGDPNDRPRDAGDMLERLRLAEQSLTEQQRAQTVIPVRTALESSRANPGAADSSAPATSAGEGTGGRNTTQVVDRSHTRVYIPPAAQARKVSKRRWLLPALLGLLLTVAGAGWWLSRDHDQRASVPSVIGKTTDDAKRILNNAGFSHVAVNGPDTGESDGRIVASSPSAGEQADRDSTITLTEGQKALSTPSSPSSSAPSSGIAVPDVLGKPQDQARALIQQAGLTVAGTRPEIRPEPAGTVVRTEPQGNTPLAPGSGVTLIVSSGPGATNPQQPTDPNNPQQPTPPATGQVNVPSVVGMPASQARAVLASFGLQAAGLEAAGGNDPVVADQSPAANSSVPNGSVVTLR